MKRFRFTTLSAKLGVVGGVLLVMALASVALTLSVTWQLEGGAAAVNEAGRMRMQAWRLAQTLAQDDPALAREQVRQLDASVQLLRQGDPERPLFLPRDDATQAAFADVQRHWLTQRERWMAFPSPPARETAQQTARLVERVDAFVSAIEARLTHWTALLHLFQLALMGLALAAAATLLYAAALFVFNPLSRLQRGLARVRSGDLAARVESASQDEFGQLSADFNAMAQTLQELYGNLENKVREKTLRVQAQSERLAALYEAATRAARAGSLDELAKGFAPLLRSLAKADASAIRWSDEANQRYVMLASDCLPQDLIDTEHCVRAGQCHCGQRAAGATTRVIPIAPLPSAGATLHPSSRCAEHGFEQVVSVPVQVKGRLLGEIDLFFRGAVGPDDEERELLDTLASHLAAAMESLRAQALEREAAVAEERGMLARELHDSIAQSLAFLKIQVQLLRGALDRGDAAAAERSVTELDAGVRESTQDVRELLVHFRTRTNLEDLRPALHSTLQKFEHQTGLNTHLNIQGQGLPLPPDVQVQVLHVVQEALSNIRKHARASEVWVDVQQHPHWRVEVRDDGRGFAGAPGADRPHVGLRIMRERADLIGARVEVASAPGQGTRVVLELADVDA